MTAHPAANLISAVPTLFAPDGAVDLAATRTAYDQLARYSFDGVFVTGTTGEFTTLTDDERLAVSTAAAEAFGPDRTYWHTPAPIRRYASPAPPSTGARPPSRRDCWLDSPRPAWHSTRSRPRSATPSKPPSPTCCPEGAQCE